MTLAQNSAPRFATTSRSVDDQSWVGATCEQR